MRWGGRNSGLERCQAEGGGGGGDEREDAGEIKWFVVSRKTQK